MFTRAVVKVLVLLVKAIITNIQIENYNSFLFSDFIFKGLVNANPDAKLLYDELLVDYNRLIRPVPNASETVVVNLSIRLSQLIDVVSLDCDVCLLFLISQSRHQRNSDKVRIALALA